jgi:hypothetical protein
MMSEGKDTSFSLGWALGGALIMFATSFVGGLVAGMLDIRDVWTHAGISLLCFFIGGYIIGKKSAGQTILEAGLAAVLAIVVALLLRGVKFPDDPVAIALGFGIPFLAALFGGWLGERAQDR